jgi:hypothetical protein
MIVGRQRDFTLRIMPLAGKTAGTGGFLEGGTGGLNKKEADLIKSKWTAERTTSHDDSRAAMPFTPMIEGKLDFRTHPERPFRQETDSLGRAVDLFLNQID